MRGARIKAIAISARYIYILRVRSRGALATILDNGSPQGAILESFFPVSVSAAPLPKDVPADIQAEFREAENTAALGYNRAASALFRSVLEKTLKTDGYAGAHRCGGSRWSNY